MKPKKKKADPEEVLKDEKNIKVHDNEKVLRVRDNYIIEDDDLTKKILWAKMLSKMKMNFMENGNMQPQFSAVVVVT